LDLIEKFVLTEPEGRNEPEGTPDDRGFRERAATKDEIRAGPESNWGLLSDGALGLAMLRLQHCGAFH
jgi:hypothetical protein